MSTISDIHKNQQSWIGGDLHRAQAKPISDSTNTKNETKSTWMWRSPLYTVVCFSFLAGILVGGVVLGVIITLYLQDKSKVINQPNNRAATLRWKSTAVTVAGLGSGGVYTNRLLLPYGLTFDSSNSLYIAEYEANRIVKWIPGARNGTIVVGSSSRAAGNTSDTLSCPVDMLLELNGDMYVTDRCNNRFQFFPSGSYFGTTKAGTGSNTSVTMYAASAIVRNLDTDMLYISNSAENRIISYPSGVTVAGGNGQGNSNKQLNLPMGLAYDQVSKSLIIGNYFGHTLVRWYLGQTNWTLLAGVPGTPGASSTSLNGPVGVTMDPMGNVYVADSDNHRIQLFINGQLEGMTVAGITGINGSNATLLSRPYWVELDSQLNLYVSDTGNGRIQKFERTR